MPGEGTAGFELGELEAIAELIEHNLYALHDMDGPACDDMLECPLEHFESGEEKRVMELKALLVKTDAQVNAKRAERDKNQEAPNA